MYDWITLLYTWNYHNIVNQLYSNIKLTVKKKEESFLIHLSLEGLGLLGFKTFIHSFDSFFYVFVSCKLLGVKR